MLKANEQFHTQLQSMQSRLDALEKAYTGKYSRLGSQNDYSNEMSSENKHLSGLFSKNTKMIEIYYQKGNKYTVKVLEDEKHYTLTSRPITDLNGVKAILQEYLGRR